MPYIALGNDDIISGWRYCATLQLRTPLFVLQQHGRLVPATSGGPPELTPEMWHGIWIPGLGEEFAYLSRGATMASEVGQIPADGGDYLPFLKAVRSISEGVGSVSYKEAALRKLIGESGPNGTPYAQYIDKEDLVDRVLPRVVSLLPVSIGIVRSLLSQQLDTLEKLAAMSDDQLLSVKYLGTKRLNLIRAFIANARIDPTCTRVLNPVFGPYAPPVPNRCRAGNVDRPAL
jgi:hypothetical protein